MSRKIAIRATRKGPASVLDKALSVLEAVERAAGPITIQEIASVTGVQRLAVYRMLSTLEQRGYVLRDDAKRYRPATRRRRVIAGYLAPLAGTAFREELTKSLETAAAQAGVQLQTFDNAEGDSQQAAGNTERLIEAGVDVAIFFQPVEAVGHIVADRLFCARVPFITVERPIQGGIYYGGNNYQAGKMAGVVLGQFAKTAWKSRFDRVVLVEPEHTSTNVHARVAGVLIGLRGALGEIDESRVVHLESRGNVESSRTAMAALLKKTERGKRLLVSGFHDLCAVGALRAVREAGRESEVAIVGQNATREGQMEIRRRNSRMIASIAYFPERYGPRLVQLASELAAGRQVPPAVYTQHVVLDRRNIGYYYPEREEGQ
jgi:ribose transport system substrate-binding protein